ncbi:MAG: imidazoleglycerol-phosphate dehydratase [Vampirovibrio sp.]|nr:imidazoleglycerol-phosphate dehydratase [Vampirovibrio sp.]
MTTPRVATISRDTKETQITLTLNLDEPFEPDIQTGLPFFDHMLTAFATHGRFGLRVKAVGDIEVDPHHLIEDTGIVLGQAIREALDGYKGIQRAGCFAFPMDGTLSVAALDLCGRPNLVWNMRFGNFTIGNLDPNLFREFYKGLADGMRGTLHFHVPCQDNDHHLVESTFKSFGRALREAVVPIGSQSALSTKGMLEA